MFKNLYDKFIKKESTRSVGRPRLADESLKNSAKITLALAVVIGAMFTLTGISVISGKNPMELLKINSSKKLLGGPWDTHPKVYNFVCKDSKGKVVQQYSKGVTYKVGKNDNRDLGGKVISDYSGPWGWKKETKYLIRLMSPSGKTVKSTKVYFGTNKGTICSGDIMIQGENIKQKEIRVVFNFKNTGWFYAWGEGVFQDSKGRTNTITQNWKKNTLSIKNDNSSPAIKDVTIRSFSSSGVLFTVNAADSHSGMASNVIKIYRGNKLLYNHKSFDSIFAYNCNAYKNDVLTLKVESRDLVKNVSYKTFTLVNNNCNMKISAGAPKAPAPKTDVKNGYCDVLPGGKVTAPGKTVKASYSIKCYGGAKISSVQYRLEGKHSWLNRPASKRVEGDNSIVISKPNNNDIYVRVLWNNNKNYSAERHLGRVITDGSVATPGVKTPKTKPNLAPKVPKETEVPSVSSGNCNIVSTKLIVGAGNRRTAEYMLSCNNAKVSTVQYKLDGYKNWQTRNKNSFKTGLSRITFNTSNNKYLAMRVCYNNNRTCSDEVLMIGR